MAHVIIGTAGHIDHGKSSLVKALTGTDPDRLPEEKKRQITIDLGYAFLDDTAAIIDVPGHEKFIRNMVAGATTIDYAILVIAANDGIMPQTREHLEILKLLNVKHGVVALTKSSLVEKNWLDLVTDQISSFLKGSFLENAHIFPLDSVSKQGISEFRSYLLQTLSKFSDHKESGIFRLPIDRVFTVKGRGTVITGTILSGQVKQEDKLSVLPGYFQVRVKGLETHGKQANSLTIGQRAALNLVGDTENLARGLTLSNADSLFASTRVKIALDVISENNQLKDRQRVRFLIGTQECIGRVQIISKQSATAYYANLLLETPAVATWNDRFILRRYSPVETLGGGRVLEPNAPRLLSKLIITETNLSHALDTDSVNDAILTLISYRGTQGIASDYVRKSFGLTHQALDSFVEQHSDCLYIENYIILKSDFEKSLDKLLEVLNSYHKRNRQKLGFTLQELQVGDFKALPEAIIRALLEDLVNKKSVIKSDNLYKVAGQGIELTQAQQQLFNKINTILTKNKFTPPASLAISEEINESRAAVEKALVQMEKLGYCKRLGIDMFFNANSFNDAVSLICDTLTKENEISISQAVKVLSSSRKYVVPLLEYLDSVGMTSRHENLRVKGRNFNSADKRQIN